MIEAYTNRAPALIRKLALRLPSLYDAAMRAVVQRVSRAEVRVGCEIVGRIACGLVILLGVAVGDDETDARYIAERILKMRIFADGAGKMNLDIASVGGAMLIVSQFTLLADVDSGRRPSFIKAAAPAVAQRLYEHVVSIVKNAGVRVETGRFGATMEVELINDGPVTIVMDSRSR